MSVHLDSEDAWAIDDKATQEAALGAHALGVGDTLSASRHYSEAGRILEGESSIAREAPKRDLLRFLAASQYFHAGNYVRAQKLARRVEERFLREQYKHLLRAFLRDVNERTSTTYVQSVRKRVQELRDN